MKTKSIFFSFLFFFNLVYSKSFSQSDDIGVPLILMGKITEQGGKSLEGVNIVLAKKGGKQITNFTTLKKGLYQIEDLVQNTTNKNFIYTIEFSKPGYVTKSLELNAYLPPAEFDESPKEVLVDVEMIPTKFSSIKIKRVYGKVKWYSDTKEYKIDQAYAKSVAAEEALLKKDPDKYLQEYKDKQENPPVDPKEDKYKNDISLADRAYDLKNWELAKNYYNDALKVKPGEKYPLERIALIDIELAKVTNGAKELNAKYTAAITRADKAFATKDYTTAQAAYNEAKLLKPADPYPPKKLKEIETAMASGSAAEKERLEKEKTAKYNAAITKGNAAFKTNKFEDAKKAYTEALAFKPNDTFASSKLKESNDKLTITATNEKTLYETAIAKGSAAFAAKKYPEAKVAYSEANRIRPTEQLPKTRLIEIQTALDALAKTEKENKEKFDAAIKNGNTAFTAKNYDVAKQAYNQALALKSNDPFLQNRIKEINEILNGVTVATNIKAEKAKYDAAIVKADAAFNSKKYEDAIMGYEEALEVKPNETYPKERIAKADEIIEGEKNKNATVVLAEPVFDGAKTFSVSKEKQKIQSEKRKLEKKKAQNLSIKYETRNVSTSLLDAVDAFDKKNKYNK